MEYCYIRAGNLLCIHEAAEWICGQAMAFSSAGPPLLQRSSAVAGGDGSDAPGRHGLLFQEDNLDCPKS